MPVVSAPANLVELAKQTAQKYRLDPVLVCAVCEQESGWDTFSMRFEPRFLARYVVPLALTNPTEEHARSISWGLMQLMGQVARELKWPGRYLSTLCEPQIGLELGCQHLANKFKQSGGDVNKALLLWNGGGDPTYPAQVLARVDTYK